VSRETSSYTRVDINAVVNSVLLVVFMAQFYSRFLKLKHVLYRDLGPPPITISGCTPAEDHDLNFHHLDNFRSYQILIHVKIKYL